MLSKRHHLHDLLGFVYFTQHNALEITSSSLGERIESTPMSGNWLQCLRDSISSRGVTASSCWGHRLQRLSAALKEKAMNSYKPQQPLEGGSGTGSFQQSGHMCTCALEILSPFGFSSPLVWEEFLMLSVSRYVNIFFLFLQPI